MKIIILTGSPNQRSSSNLLVEYFIKGAREAGHVVGVVDTTRVVVRPCTGCLYCKYDGPCVMKDDMEKIKAHILAADMVVFSTPLYYYGMSAQLKTAIDRFCSFNTSIQKKRMKSALISTCWNTDAWTFDSLAAHYKSLARYLNFTDMGMVLGMGCGSPEITMRSQYAGQAYMLGKSLQ